MRWSETKLGAWWLELPILLRDWAIVLAVAVVVGLGGGVAWLVLKKPYAGWQQTKAVERGRQAAEAGRYTEALMAFQRATQLRPDDVQTWREVAEFLSKLGSPEALVARENVVRLEPEDMGYRLALVEESLRLGDMVIARRELTQLERRAVEDASFYRLAAALALALGRQGDLQTALEKLLELEPDNQAVRFNLAALRLWGADETAVGRAAVELERLMTLPDWEVRGALELLKRSAVTRDPAVVDGVVARVLGRLDPAGADLALKQRTSGEPPGWGALMKALKARAATRPEDAAALAEWWARVGGRTPVIAWVDGLNAEVAQSAPVREVLTGLVAAEGPASRLDGLLASGSWGAINRDALTLAMAARWQGQREETGRADQTWQDAVKATAGDAAGLRVLVRLGAVWRRTDWQIAALWPLVTEHPGEHWALEALRTALALRRDDAGLLKLYEIWATRTLDSEPVQATRLMLAALLDRMNSSAEEARRRLETRTDTGPVARLALAAAYWRAGDTDKARTLLAGLPADQADGPKSRLWFGLVATQADKRDEARRLLGDLDDRGWLPAERKLRADALETLRQRDRRDADAARKAAQAGP
jgi:thioredoxin-like negative regulator of GroEL